MALLTLNKSKLQSPIIVIDPVQPDRNAAAALGERAFTKLKQIADQFLRAPTTDFFAEKIFDISSLKKRGAIVVRAKPFEGKQDVVGAKMIAVFDSLCQTLEPFGILETDWQWTPGSDAMWYIVPRVSALPETYEHPGPPIDKVAYADHFRRKYPGSFVKKGRGNPISLDSFLVSELELSTFP